MRDVSAKSHTLRTARARAVLSVSPSSIQAMRQGTVPKGDPLPVAKVAAIQAAKATPQWIAYCHTVPIDHVGVEFQIDDAGITVDVSVKAVYKTGVEMEAMTGAMAAALNIYDILKMIDDHVEVTSVRLLDKTGGKSNFEAEKGWTCGVLVVSDRVSAGTAEDESGALLRDRLQEQGGDIVEFGVVPDERQAVRTTVERWCGKGLDLVLVTGGTGLGPRDQTPEALHGIFDKRLPGVEAKLHAYGRERTPTAILGRPVAGVVGETVLIALPGSVGAVKDALDALFPYLTHAFVILAGGGH